MEVTAIMPKSPTFEALRSKLRIYYVLTKPEVNLLILMTTASGYWIGSSGRFSIAGFLSTLLGTLLVASGTATLNQWMERVWDGHMRRTRNRPLPSGRIAAGEAFLFGVLLSLAGGLMLALVVNRLSAYLAISTLLSYLLIYTPLKRKTALCTLLGAIPGAMPTLIGWAGAANRIQPGAWWLFAILFLWQFPHFLAIALMYREDYARAGYRMLPRFDQDASFTRAEIFILTLLLIVATMLPLAGAKPISLVWVIAAGGFLLYPVLKLARNSSTVLARRVVHASVIYLPVVLTVMAVYKA